MAVLIFPSSPASGDLFPTVPLVGQSQYQWEAATSTWRLLGVSTGVSTGTYGNATSVGQFTVDAQGRLTSAANVAIALNFVTAPTSSTSAGTTGEVAVDATYLYMYTSTRWQRIAWDATVW